jgi:hypothetical protein
MSQDTVRLQTPLHDSWYQNNLPSGTMQEPARDEILSNGEFREFPNLGPGLKTNDESAPRTPCGIASITKGVISTGAGGVALVEGIILRDIVMKLHWSAGDSNQDNGLHT